MPFTLKQILRKGKNEWSYSSLNPIRKRPQNLPFVFRALLSDCILKNPSKYLPSPPMRRSQHHIMVPELQSASIVTHYKLIMSDSFPWAQLDMLIRKIFRIGEIVAKEMEKWDDLYTLKGFEAEGDEEMMREAVNDALLWALVIDDWTEGRVPEISEVVESVMGDIRSLTLVWEDVNLGTIHFTLD